MSYQRQKAIACVGLASVFLFKRNKKKRSRWSKHWFTLREDNSDMKLLQELRTNEPEDYQNYLRMDSSTFDALLKLVGPQLQKKDTPMRNCISPEERLVATLRYLATGRNYECLKFSSSISPQSLGRIIPETCKVIYEVLRKEYLKFPTSVEEWKEIGNGFQTKWQFPNCGGAIDGKHIRIICPAKSGALYYNYKNFYSVVLMAIVNANYEFIYVDVGKNGRNSDGGILEYTSFFDKLSKNKLNLPGSEENTDQLNFVFIGDEAFRLHKNILKPYSQTELTYEKRIFNYRLSRARNVVENAFGLISARFRVLHTAISVKPNNAKQIVMAICVLHNFLRRKSKSYSSYRTVDTEDHRTHHIRNDGEWRNNSVDLSDLGNIRQTNTTLNEKANREKYCQYFNGNGSVPWQQLMISAGKA